jgi:alkaline phosphatase D
MVEANKAELRWMDSSNRGYMLVSLTPQAATSEWVFMDTVKQVSMATKPSHRMKVRPGRKVLEQA